MKPSSQENKPAQVPLAINNLLRKARIVCDETMVDAELTREMEQVSANIDHLSPDQRRALQEIGQIMTYASAKPVKGLDRPGEFSMELSEDRLHMLLTVIPPLAGGKPISTSDVVEELRRRNIEKGVMLQEIQKSVFTAKSGKEVTQQPIVRGVPATPGTDGYVEFFGRAELNRDIEPVSPEKALDINQSSIACVKDDLVAVYHPPVPGTHGFDAAGQVLDPPVPGDIALEAGPNIVRQGDTFIAQITGMLQFDGKVISVKPVLIFAHDVTAESGPIAFDGEIMVQGTVRSGVKMKATGHITIHGNVEAANIESLQGEIKIHQGIVGRGEAVLVAMTNISTKFVENATLRAQNDIYIENGSMHSFLVAGNKIEMIHGKGQLIGGSTMAGKLVAARIVGTPSGLHTEISVGLSSKAMKVLSRIDFKRRSLQSGLAKCTPLIENIYKMVTDPSKLDKGSLQTLSTLKQMQFILQMKMDKYNARRQKVMAFAAQDTSGTVDILDDLQPGVVVRIGNSTLENKQAGRHRQFAYDLQSKRVICRGLK